MRYGFVHRHEHWAGGGLIGLLVVLLVIAVCAFVAVRVMRRTSLTTPYAPPGGSGRETPEELLDRRFASGEIDAEAHAAARQHLRDHPR